MAFAYRVVNTVENGRPAKRTDMAFPPYWFLLTQDGKDILYEDMNIAKAVGTHVPLQVPADLKASKVDYFSERNEVRDVLRPNSHTD